MKVTWTCYLHQYTAMGVIAINVVKELTKLGYDIGLNAINPPNDPNPVKPQDYPIEVQEALKKGYRFDSTNIFFAYPDVYPHIRCKVNVGYTGADSTGWYTTSGSPPPWSSCNEFTDFMLTPADYSRRIMKDCGVTKSIDLFPHGIDTSLFPYQRRKESSPFTFVYCGEMSKRKGTQDLIIAFKELFGTNEKYRLLLRSNMDMLYYNGSEIEALTRGVPNIEVHFKNFGQQELAEYYKRGHVYVYPSRADWFGMTVFESLASGLPTIATATNGYYEFLKDYIIPVKTEDKEIGNEHPYLKGKWHVVNKEHLKEQMFNTVFNYEEELKKARIASLHIHENYTWEKVTKDYLVPFLDKVKYQPDKTWQFLVDPVAQEPPKETKPVIKDFRVTVGIPTKDRGIELAMLLQSLTSQTYQNFDVLINDDGLTGILSNNTTIQGLFTYLRQSGHNVTIMKGKTLGPHVGGQAILDNCKTELILRLDDDVALEPQFIEKLVEVFKDDDNNEIAAVGPIYLNPHEPLQKQKIDLRNFERQYKDGAGKIFWLGPNQLFISGLFSVNRLPVDYPIEVEHLYSGFMYRTSVAKQIGGYNLELSKVGHREETIFSYSMFKAGYKLFIQPNSIAYHYHPMQGGIRETTGQIHKEELWKHDEEIFTKWIRNVLPPPGGLRAEDLPSEVEQYGPSLKREDPPLNILLATNHLLNLTGSELTIHTIASYLKKYENNIWLYAKFVNNDFLEIFKSLNIHISNNLNDFKDIKFDVAYIQHNTTAYIVRDKFPTLPMVFSKLGIIPSLEQIPEENLNISKYLAISEEAAYHIQQKGVSPENIKVFRNIVDSSKFLPVNPLNEVPKKAIIYNSKRHPVVAKNIIEACKILNIELVDTGSKETIIIPQSQVQNLMNDADIIFTLGRGAIETMFCGRVPFIYDYLGGTGLLTPETFHEVCRYNLSGRPIMKYFTTEEIVNEIKNKYNFSNGEKLRNLAIKYFSANNLILDLIDILKIVSKEKNDPIPPDKQSKIKEIIGIIEGTSWSSQCILDYKLKDKEIDFNDIPEITEEQIKQAKPIKEVYPQLFDKTGNKPKLNLDEYQNNKLVSIVILTHGEHHKGLRDTVKGIVDYTKVPYEIVIVNNDTRTYSITDLEELVNKEYRDKIASGLKIKVINLPVEVAVGTARNIGVENVSEESEHIVFIDDDATILGFPDARFGTDWIDFMLSIFNESKDVAAVSPIHTWYHPLKTNAVSVACMLTSKKVWGVVGGFDSVFGNKEKGTWGYEDVDWSYRAVSLGYKLKWIGHPNAFPFYHMDTTLKSKSESQGLALLKAQQILHDKYNLEEIEFFNRIPYPLTREQMEDSVNGIKLNVGCYHTHFEDFINVDIKNDVGADLISDMRSLDQHFAPGSVSLILSSHSLEHIPVEDAKVFLEKCFKILRPGGHLVVEVPDCEDMDARVAKGEMTQYDKQCHIEGMPSEFGQKHEYCYIESDLRNMLTNSGFEIVRRNPQVSVAALEDRAIRLDCVKRS